MKKIIFFLITLCFAINVFGRGGSGPIVTLTGTSDTILLTEVDSYGDNSYTWYINTGQNENIAISYIMEMQPNDVIHIQEFMGDSYRSLVTITGGNGTRTGVVYTSQPNGRARIILEYGTQQHHAEEHIEIAYSSAPSAILKSMNVLGNVGIGTLAPAYTLDVIGTIRSREIIVETGGADFVFEEGYNLLPLSEVESYLQDNRHLPGIKPALEMQKNGICVSELQMQLLQKIEELMLYIIQQEKRVQALEVKISE